MQSRKVDTMHVLELKVSDAEITSLLKLARAPETPPELTAFLESLLPEVKHMRPPCFGIRAEIEIRTEPCSSCGLSVDCVEAANATPAAEAPPEPRP